MTPLDERNIGVLQGELTQGRPTRFVGRNVICERGWLVVRKSLRLSPREFEIVQRIFDDMNELDIATELGISRHTVHTHLERLYRKASVNSRTQLIIHAISDCRSLCMAASQSFARIKIR